MRNNFAIICLTVVICFCLLIIEGIATKAQKCEFEFPPIASGVLK